MSSCIVCGSDLSEDIVNIGEQYPSALFLKENDPFRSTMKGIYNKVKEQEKKPLFEDPGKNLNSPKNAQTKVPQFEVPNYQEIKKQASTIKNKT